MRAILRWGSVDGILEGPVDLMKPWDYSTLLKMVADRQLGPAIKLTVGQVRIATVPRVIRPEREGTFDPAWLKPLPSRPPSSRAGYVTPSVP